jgi:hypothetical protein
MASISKTEQLCEDLSRGLNGFIGVVKNGRPPEEDGSRKVQLTDKERQLLIDYYTIFFNGISQVIPEENLLKVKLEVPGVKGSETSVELDVKNLYLATLAKQGLTSSSNFDDTLLFSIDEQAGDEALIGTLARSLMQKFPTILLEGLVADVKLTDK